MKQNKNMVYKTWFVQKDEQGLSKIINVFTQAQSVDDAIQKVRAVYPTADIRMVSDEPDAVIL